MFGFWGHLLFVFHPISSHSHHFLLSPPKDLFEEHAVMFSGTTENSYCFIAYLFEGGFSASPESLSHTLGINLCHQHPGAQASADTPQSLSLLAESRSTGPRCSWQPTLPPSGMPWVHRRRPSFCALPPTWLGFIRAVCACPSPHCLQCDLRLTSISL